MPKPLGRLKLNELRERLLRAGVAPRHVRRYLAELNDHFADLRAEEELSGLTPTEAESAALLRLGTPDDLAAAMATQPQFQSWSARAPWAVFGIAPPVLLATAYFIACLYLWSLWLIVLPGTDTPFGHASPGPIYGLTNICFQVGKFFYTGAPILVGWSILFLAARQRINATWPIAGALLIALIHSTAQVQASRATVPGNPAHIRISFALGGAQDLYGHLLYALLLFTLTALPYLLWRFRNALAHSA